MSRRAAWLFVHRRTTGRMRGDALLSRPPEIRKIGEAVRRDCGAFASVVDVDVSPRRDAALALIRYDTSPAGTFRLGFFEHHAAERRQRVEMDQPHAALTFWAGGTRPFAGGAAPPGVTEVVLRYGQATLDRPVVCGHWIGVFWASEVPGDAVVDDAPGPAVDGHR